MTLTVAKTLLRRGEDESKRNVPEDAASRYLARTRKLDPLCKESTATTAACRVFTNGKLMHYSVRADSGSDHSKENPSFIAGVAGGAGSPPDLDWSEPNVPGSTFRSPDDLVSVPIANFVIVGGSQLRRALLDIGRIIVSGRSRRGHPMGSDLAWQHTPSASNRY